MGVAMIGSTKCAASAGLPVKRAASKAVIGERFSEQVFGAPDRPYSRRRLSRLELSGLAWGRDALMLIVSFVGEGATQPPFDD